MKKNDIILASAIGLIALAMFLIAQFNRGEGSSVYVYKDNMLIKTHNLRENGSYDIKQDDLIIMEYCIKDGTVDVISSNCKNKICVNHHVISQKNDVICCLPNKIVIKIVNDDHASNDNVDVIAY